MLLAGIDEAGYGPTLGPLCIGAALFRVTGEPDRDDAPDLWRSLRAAVCRSPQGLARGLIPVDDSKRLKRPGGFAPAEFARAVERLERGVLAFLSTSGAACGCDRSLLATLTRGRSLALDWYADGSTPFPLPASGDQQRAAMASARLARVMEGAGVSLVALRCAVIDERRFNDQVRRTGSKAAVSLRVVGGMLSRVWTLLGREPPDASGLRRAEVRVDRQGGRTRYLEGLRRRLIGAEVRIVEEAPARSVYEAVDGATGRSVRIAFEVDADRLHLPVALASMTAKYARELLMRRFNAYWCARIAELKPTAGYATDARRWLTDAGPHLTAEERRTLVRLA